MISELFEAQYKHAPDITQHTPGRVNLIGEHIDYNGGMVLPAALSRKVSLAVSKRQDNKIFVHSTHFKESHEADLDTPASDHWADYAIGAVQIATQAGLNKTGVNIALDTDLPIGAGLSSSSATIVGILKAFRALSQSDVDDVEIARLARKVENDYIGVPCGIMDQMAVSIAIPGQALALDTATLDYDIIDLPEGYDIVITHSGQHRKLSDGHYKIRREECDAAALALGVEYICLISETQAKDIANLPDPVQRRARHCYTEHLRTKAALAALKAKDIMRFGELMAESHVSMRDDFEMSLPQIDALVEDAMKFGAVGSRLTGGGFGGCIVSCVKTELRDEWETKLLAAHPDAFKVL